MNTEKAIEFCKFVEDLDTYGEDNAYVVANGIPCVIEHIEELEKYKKIVEETEQFLEPGVIIEIPDDMLGSRHIDIIIYQFKKIKEKYFPKPVKKTIIIKIKAKDDKTIEDQFKIHADLLFSNRENIGYVIKSKEGD